MTSRKYDLEAMQTFIDLLDQAITAIGQRTEATKNVADGVLSQFSGTAAQAFSDSQTDWLTGTKSYTDELRMVRDKIALAHRNYSQAEQANREMRA
ncbi:WXG100 family type VII secretion target [Nocardia sp. NPDC058480]|uniref:WXG100 family type VII secretion target n=1 Tax=unclassified Nocardia TaxID=2637762 RepID=UPI00365FB80A